MLLYQALPLILELLRPIEGHILVIPKVDHHHKGEIINDSHVVPKPPKEETIPGPHAFKRTRSKNQLSLPKIYLGTLPKSIILQILSCSL